MSKVFGLTIDQLTDVAQTTLALKALPQKPTIRLVVDPDTDIQDYVVACRSFSTAAFIIPQICDSYNLAKTSLTNYVDKTEILLEKLGPFSIAFEIGNEINGNWCGTDVWEKVLAAQKLTEDQGFPSVLTLYYDENLWDWVWLDINVQREVFDLVLLSYYPDDTGLSNVDWEEQFAKLSLRFPTSDVGFGEFGSEQHPEHRALLINQIYKLKLKNPKYVCGGFYWDFYRDCVPKNKRLWNEIAGSWK